jgi:hypothetical protein
MGRKRRYVACCTCASLRDADVQQRPEVLHQPIRRLSNIPAHVSEEPRACTVGDIAPIKLDAEDDFIVRMKEAGYRDRAIAKYLAEQNRTAYSIKSISNRWIRLKKDLAEHNDKLLAAGHTAWHAGDDVLLQQALVSAEQEVREAIERAKAKKWQLVADHMKKAKPVTNFSPQACRHRAENLQQSSIIPTPESVENPDPTTLAQIKLRQDRRARIEADRALMPTYVKAEALTEEYFVKL